MQKGEVKKYEYIDSLRGLAILLVILVHAAQHFETLSPAVFFLAYKGQYGVQLFFISSALTLFLSYAQRGSIDQGNTVKFFLIRRLFRIAPAFYIAIILYSALIVLQPVSSMPNPIRIVDVILSIFFINGFFPGSINYVPPGGWSVAIEMIFYLLIPFFFARIKTLRTAIWFFLGTVVLAYLSNRIGAYLMINYTHLDYAYQKTWYFYFWLPNQLPVFMLGILLFHVLKRHITLSKAMATLIIVLSTVVMISLFYIIRFYKLEDAVPEHILVGILFSCIVFAMSKARIGLLENKVTRELGKLSFSMYLWHFIILQGLAYVIRRVIHADPGIQVAILYLAGVPIIALVSSISYDRIEMKGIQAGKKVIEKMQRKPAPHTPPKVNMMNRKATI